MCVCGGLIPLHEPATQPQGDVHLTTPVGQLAEQELCPPMSRSSPTPSFPGCRETAVPLRLSASSSLTSTCA